MTEYIRKMRSHIGHDTLILVGVGVFIHKDGKLLLQRRRDNNCWADHGGCVEIGEKVEDTARRELFEETGLIANKLELIGVFSGENMMYTYPNGDQAYIIGISYLCEDFSGTPVSETDETVDLQWFDIDNLPDNISPPSAEPLRRCVEILKSRLSNKFIKSSRTPE